MCLLSLFLSLLDPNMKDYGMNCRFCSNNNLLTKNESFARKNDFYPRNENILKFSMPLLILFSFYITTFILSRYMLEKLIFFAKFP